MSRGWKINFLYHSAIVIDAARSFYDHRAISMPIILGWKGATLFSLTAIPAWRMQRRTWMRLAGRELWWSNHFDDLIIGVGDRATFGRAITRARFRARGRETRARKSNARRNSAGQWFEDFPLRGRDFCEKLSAKNVLAEEARGTLAECLRNVRTTCIRRRAAKQRAVYVKQISNAKRCEAE